MAGWQGWHVAGSFAAGAAAAAAVRALLRHRALSGAAALATDSRWGEADALQQFLLHIAPKLDGSAHKGQAGRIGVLGGSKDYTGAPYYTGQAALSVGADLLYLFTAEEACNPIKSYSPELMVTPVYSAKWPEGEERGVEAMVAAVVETLPRLHSLVIGPGLGRDEAVLRAVGQILLAAKERQLPIVIDADGLWLVTQQPELVRGCASVILTPNKIEFARLREALGIGAEGSAEDTLKAVCAALGGVTVLQKGPVDLISDGGGLLSCDMPGGPRRSGGLGDVLAGTLGIVNAWASMAAADGAGDDAPWAGQERLWAAWAACAIVRASCGAAFARHRRATTAVHVLEELGAVFEGHCPAAAL